MNVLYEYINKNVIFFGFLFYSKMGFVGYRLVFIVLVIWKDFKGIRFITMSYFIKLKFVFLSLRMFYEII